MEQLQNRLRMKYFARLATLFSCLFITIALTAQNDSVAPQAVTRTQDMIDYEKVLDKGMENMFMKQMMIICYYGCSYHCQFFYK